MKEAVERGMERARRRDTKARPKMKVSGRGMKRFGARKPGTPRRP